MHIAIYLVVYYSGKQTFLLTSLHDVSSLWKVEVEIKEKPTADESKINVSE